MLQADEESRRQVSKQKYRIVVVGVLLVLALIGFVVYKLVSTPKLPVLNQISDFTLEKVDGSPFHFGETDGKIRLVSFIYTNCPDVCPATTYHMAELQEMLKKEGLYGEDVVFVSVAFDPERDTPEALRKYAKTYNADTSGWYFVRGNAEAINEVAKEFWVGIQKQENGLYLHTMKTFLIDRDKNLRKMYGMAAEMDLEEIKADMKRLARE